MLVFVEISGKDDLLLVDGLAVFSVISRSISFPRPDWFLRRKWIRRWAPDFYSLVSNSPTTSGFCFVEHSCNTWCWDSWFLLRSVRSAVLLLRYFFGFPEDFPTFSYRGPKWVNDNLMGGEWPHFSSANFWRVWNTNLHPFPSLSEDSVSGYLARD